MKNTLSLLMFALLLNCSAEKTYMQLESGDKAIKTAATKNSSSLFGGAVGAVDRSSGKMSFLKDQKTILKIFNSVLEKSDITANLTELKLEQSNGVYYLKGYGADYRSTMLLVKDDFGNLQSAGTTCTTSACATSTGCSATTDGRCTECTGDCKKSTTSD